MYSAPRPVALQGPFPFLRIDGEGSVQSRHHDLDRVIYKAVSDTAEPNPDPLRRDLRLYPASFARYLQLPESLDPRISELARAIVISADARNRYDAARAIERQLQTNYGYTLEMKAGGPELSMRFALSAFIAVRRRPILSSAVTPAHPALPI